MDRPEQVIIVLPLPPRVLSPNCPAGTRGGRFARAAAAKRYKQLAESATVEAAAGMAWAMLKPAYDGVVLAGLIPDDDRAHLRTEGAEFFVDKKNPRVELVFTREG